VKGGLALRVRLSLEFETLWGMLLLCRERAPKSKGKMAHALRRPVDLITPQVPTGGLPRESHESARSQNVYGVGAELGKLTKREPTASLNSDFKLEFVSPAIRLGSGRARLRAGAPCRPGPGAH